MNLEIQIQSLIFSFVFGLYFSLLFNLFYKFLFKDKKIYTLLINLIFVLMNIILYFILLKVINNGILHMYFIGLLFLGFIIGNRQTRKLRKYKDKIVWRVIRNNYSFFVNAF